MLEELQNIQNTETETENTETEIKQETEIATDFDDFVKDLEEPKEFDINEIQEQEGLPLKCPYCKWKTHANAKDKKRGLKNHIKKCRYNPELDFKDISTQQTEKKKRNIKVNIEKVEKELSIEEEIDIDDEEKRLKLISDLDILKIKFEGVSFKWNYSNSSSIKHLTRQKALFLRVLNDSAGTEALMKLLVVSSSAIEKVANITNTVNLDGYALDVNNSRDEIYPILKNLVDTGVVSVEHLSPELRLGMIMISLAATRMDKNRLIKNNSNFLDQTGKDESEYL